MRIICYPALLACVFLLVACNGTNPAAPRLNSLPETADQAVEDFRYALATLDNSILEDILADGFIFDGGRNDHILGTDSLDRGRFLLALSRMGITDLSQQPCPVDSVYVEFYSNEQWTAHTRVQFPDSYEKTYRVGMQYRIPDCDKYFGVIGALDFFARACTLGTSPEEMIGYELIGVSDRTQDSGKAMFSDSFSEVIAAYLSEGLPHAEMDLTELRGTDQKVFILDGSASWCEGEGLHAEAPYRWVIDDDPSAEWIADSTAEFQFADAGAHHIALEVRNQAGWVSRATAGFEIFASYPSTLEELLATFTYAHQSGDTPVLLSCVTNDFVFKVHPNDVLEYGLESDHFGLLDFYAATLHLYDGVPRLDRPPIVLHMDFRLVELSVPEVGKAVVQISLVLLDADHLSTSGLVNYVAAPVPVDRTDGRTGDVWLFSEISDLTPESSTWGGNTSWGGILATYR